MSSMSESDKKAASFNAAYVLRGHKEEVARLIEQHETICVRAFNGALYTAPLDLRDFKAGDVLDVGTGSGVWLWDLSNRLEKADVPPGRLIGIDMTDEPFSETPLKGANIDYQVCNVTSLPTEWSNRFVLVHQRLLIGALTREDWNKALGEMFRVVKPGGCIQLVETSKFSRLVGWTSRYETVTASSKHLLDAITTMFELRGLDVEVSYHLPAMLHEQGFQDVELVEGTASLGDANDAQAKIASDNLGKGLLSLSPALVRQGSYASVEEVQIAMKQLQRDFGDSNMDDLLQSIHARKPAH